MATLTFILAMIGLLSPGVVMLAYVIGASNEHKKIVAEREEREQKRQALDMHNLMTDMSKRLSRLEDRSST